jgi:hypothetical protein
MLTGFGIAPPSNASGQKRKYSAWDERLGELADYRTIHGHCNARRGSYSDDAKLGEWVGKQRAAYRLHVDGKSSTMTTFRIKALESLGFEWYNSARKDCLSELADYRKIHGTAMFLITTAKTPSLAIALENKGVNTDCT